MAKLTDTLTSPLRWAWKWFRTHQPGCFIGGSDGDAWKAYWWKHYGRDFMARFPEIPESEWRKAGYPVPEDAR